MEIKRCGSLILGRCLRLVDQRPEVLNEVQAWDLKMPNTVGLGILEGASIIPTVVVDAIGSNDRPRAIGPVQAMYENRAG